MAGIIVNEQHTVCPCPQYSQHITEMRRISFPFSHVVTVEDKIKPSEKVMLTVETIEPVRLIAQNPRPDVMDSDSFYDLDHPVPHYETGQYLAPQKRIASLDAGYFPHGIPEGILIRLAENIPRGINGIKRRPDEFHGIETIMQGNGLEAILETLFRQNSAKIKQNRFYGRVISV
jgi:hypothetical protein